ncbi:hypothetical protein [Micromonospora fulviviridis]|uniref:hypothetical protein n=1 Tax=Micromonospora fulviviridis TaxID=47860 RepID=UPI001E3C1209|nr:hypothetical protein [Micromonospora fulviviridis]
MLRDDRDQLTPGRLTTVRVDPYWRRVLALFECYRQIVHNPGKPVGRDILAELHPGHWWLVANRWPELVPAFPGSRA